VKKLILKFGFFVGYGYLRQRIFDTKLKKTKK